MKYKIIAMLLLVGFAFAACDSKSNTPQRRRRSASLLTPVSSGNPYEIMVVADDSVWNGYAGKALRQILDKHLIGLPQDEPQFHKSHIEEKHYDNITNLFRNIIHIEISREYTKAKMVIERDVHSTPQLILSVHAPSQYDASVYITEHTKAIETLFSSEEINREANDLYFEHNIKFAKKVKEMFGCDFYIPVDIKSMKIGEDFIWASDDGLSTIQNICIYSLPYVSEKMFTKKPYIALRDTMMKRNIPGERPGEYMQTNPDFVWTKNISVKNYYSFEARGLWEMRNVAMGGPFVSHSRIDKKNNRVIVVEGFVYAPEKMKRTMIRRLEAALYTLRTPDQIEAEDGEGEN
ncbi:MAG: DUF4837 family protein [Bacteroidaceae bacterium]|nr:DUF4837 family protein [Bacteroidaceae bacterium]